MKDLTPSKWITYEEYEDNVKAYQKYIDDTGDTSKQNFAELFLLNKLNELAKHSQMMKERYTNNETFSKEEVRNFRTCLEKIARLNTNKGEIVFSLVELRYQVQKISAEGTILSERNSRASEHVYSKILNKCMLHFNLKGPHHLSKVCRSGKETLIKHLKNNEYPSRDLAIRYLSFFNLGYPLTHFIFDIVGYRLRSDERHIEEFLQKTNIIDHEKYLDVLNSVLLNQYNLSYLHKLNQKQK